MRKKNNDAWNNRPLVTETLPYEVPVIFTNDKFYFATSKKFDDTEIKKALSKIHQKIRQHTKPYQYSIKKDSSRTTDLSLMHPLWQLEICDFYKSHEGSLLSHCAKSTFSLRRPVAIASMFTDSPVDKAQTTSKTGIVESADKEDEIDTSHFISYFVYANYNLLSKFYESSEFIRLEKRFRFMRTLDVSKCFYHIYTHSVSWAVKDKAYAKNHSNAHSFEGRFDQMMQKANYNETNGIVVGPELSRIFAEIILQRVDTDIERRLRIIGFENEQQYAIRRYVDDYSVFSNSSETLNKIQEVIAEELSKMKLYLNEKKIESFERPFVTPLTLARTELGKTLKNLEDLLSEDRRVRFVAVRDALRDARSIVARHGIDFGNVSGWLLSALNRIVLRANGKVYSTKTPEQTQLWGHIVRSTLELAFHLCALDLRVRSTYNICQIINSIYKCRKSVPEEEFDDVQHKVCEELIQLVAAFADSSLEHDSVELYNIIITGAYFIGADFTKTKKIRDEIDRLLNSDLSYFKFITLTFCLLSDRVFFSSQIDRLSKAVERKLLDGTEIRRDAEQFLLFADYLSSPLVENNKKREIFKILLGGSPLSAATMEQLSDIVGFVDWKGVNVDHLLRRKELRPVYAMA